MRHGKAGHQLKVLMHHAYAHCHGRLRAVAGGRFLILDIDFTGGGPLQAVQLVHQRAFPRAVFPHQGEYLALVNGQGYIVVGQSAGKLLAHMGEADNLLLHGVLLITGP